MRSTHLRRQAMDGSKAPTRKCEIRGDEVTYKENRNLLRSQILSMRNATHRSLMAKSRATRKRSSRRQRQMLQVACPSGSGSVCDSDKPWRMHVHLVERQISGSRFVPRRWRKQEWKLHHIPLQMKPLLRQHPRHPPKKHKRRLPQKQKPQCRKEMSRRRTVRRGWCHPLPTSLQGGPQGLPEKNPENCRHQQRCNLRRMLQILCRWLL
mmetsp:Transcript_3173/g.7346  ORF Transcript_3173/g.7346 Transcript_3173/m.7346 type:complete len:209 (-) Transcript_3173:1423-2049(-)